MKPETKISRNKARNAALEVHNMDRGPAEQLVAAERILADAKALVTALKAANAAHASGVGGKHSNPDYTYNEAGNPDVLPYADRIVLLSGEIESLAYGLRMKAGIWPSFSKR